MDKNYRYLEKDEIIQDGDEVDNCNNPMKDDPIWEKTTCVGEKAPDPQYPSHRIFRREIEVKK